MSPGVDAPDSRLAPMDVSEIVEGGVKVSKVVVEVFSSEHLWWDRYVSYDLDSLMTMLFKFSLSYDIVGIQTSGFLDGRRVYLSLKECVGCSSNIDKEMMDAISGIEFDDREG